MLQSTTIRFLKDLKKNNNKNWFDTHRSAYDAAKRDYEVFVQRVIDEHSKKDRDLAGLEARKCIFRINRDVRFSKNKLPYKNHFAASLDKGGRKSGLAGYYFHLEPGHHFLGAGIWQPDPDRLKLIRQEIDYSADELKKILNAKRFRSIYPGLYTGENVQLKNIPHGFEKDNPAGEYLKFKSWMVLSYLPDSLVSSPDLLPKTLAAFREAMPFVKFLNRPFE